MFGYVRVCKPELRIREWNRYRSVYCGICFAIKKQFGHLPRLTVNYDAAFMALFCLALDTKEQPPFPSRCVASPFRPHGIAAPHPILDYAAGVTVYLAYLHCLDDVQDGQQFRGQAGKLALQSAGASFEKQYPQLCQSLREGLREEALLEKEKPSLEATDHPSKLCGRLLGEVAVQGFSLVSPPQQQPPLSSLLRLVWEELGEWVYWMDAMDDYFKDEKKGRYNPLRQKDLTPQKAFSWCDQRLQELEDQMNTQASLLPYVKDAEIVENVLSLGLLEKRQEILERRRPELKSLSAEGIL